MKNLSLIHLLLFSCLLVFSCKTKPPTQEETPPDYVYTHEDFKITVKGGWTAQKAEFSNALNIVKDNYILYINPNFAPVNEDMLLAAVAKGAPGADLYWEGDFSLNCVNRTKKAIGRNLNRQDFFSNNMGSIDCKVADHNQPRWIFSHVYGKNNTYYVMSSELGGEDMENNKKVAITMTYRVEGLSDGIAELPKANSRDLIGRYLPDMTTMVESIDF